MATFRLQALVLAFLLSCCARTVCAAERVDPLPTLRDALTAMVRSADAVQLRQLDINYRHGKDIENARDDIRSRERLIREMSPQMLNSVAVRYQILEFAQEAVGDASDFVDGLRRTASANRSDAQLRDSLTAASAAYTQLESAARAYKVDFLLRLVAAEERLKNCAMAGGA